MLPKVSRSRLDCNTSRLTTTQLDQFEHFEAEAIMEQEKLRWQAMGFASEAVKDSEQLCELLDCQGVDQAMHLSRCFRNLDLACRGDLEALNAITQALNNLRRECETAAFNIEVAKLI